jgi:general secretion pathway protein A
VLEQIRLLTNLETNQKKLLQIIMLGQPELRDMLAREDLRQLSQRITARFHLGPLPVEEIYAYIAHRLAIAGVRTRLFPDATIRKIYALSGGIPRLINLLCDRALLGTYSQGKEYVDAQTLMKAAIEVLPDKGNHRKYAGNSVAGAAAVAFVAACIALLVLYYSGRYRYAPVQNSIEPSPANAGHQTPPINTSEPAFDRKDGRWERKVIWQKITADDKTESIANKTGSQESR